MSALLISICRLSSGVIAGIAVGAVALLASIVLAFFFWRKTAGRSKHASMVIEDRPLPPNSLVYTPFTMGSTTQSELLPPSERPSAPSTSDFPSNSVRQCQLIRHMCAHPFPYADIPAEQHVADVEPWREPPFAHRKPFGSRLISRKVVHRKCEYPRLPSAR